MRFEHNSEQFGYIDLETLNGVQTALTRLSFDAGTADGKDGPRTQQAVRAFQASVTIKIDGIVGVETREALMKSLDARVAQTPPSV